VFLVLTIGAMGLVTLAAKAIGDRPRPDTALTFASSTAFPSGHALGMAVGVLAFSTVLWPHLTAASRGPVIVVGVVLTVLAGLARVVLNVHHPSDVLAGWALGFLFYSICVAVVHPWAGERRSRPQEPAFVSPG
jgi:undecaprenyl-diphosphatase